MAPCKHRPSCRWILATIICWTVNIQAVAETLNWGATFNSSWNFETKNAAISRQIASSSYYSSCTYNYEDLSLVQDLPPITSTNYGRRTWGVGPSGGTGPQCQPSTGNGNKPQVYEFYCVGNHQYTHNNLYPVGHDDYWHDQEINNGSLGVACLPPPTCPSGSYYSFQYQSCIADQNPEKMAGTPRCPTCRANPINVATGNKFQREDDYVGASPFPLTFSRFYNSLTSGTLQATPSDGVKAVVNTSTVGRRWRHTYDRSIEILHSELVLARRPDGQTVQFNWTGSNWMPDIDVGEILAEVKDGGGLRIGWRLTNTDQSAENYNASGRLMSTENTQGMVHSLNYYLPVTEGGDGDPNTLDKITDERSGRTLTFAYSGRLQSMTDPSGKVYSYTYDYSNANGPETRVIYPDDDSDPGNNPVRKYEYATCASIGNPAGCDTSTWAIGAYLTGIVDENGVKYATWTYDDVTVGGVTLGRVTSSKHGDPSAGVTADHTTVQYNADGTVSATEQATQQSQIYSFASSAGVRRVTAIGGERCTTCGEQFKSATYYPSGLMQSKTDFNDNVTEYEYAPDGRGLESRRTEARKRNPDGTVSDTPEMRVIETVWHPTLRLPIEIREPGKVTTFEYDASGNLTNKTIKVPPP